MSPAQPTLAPGPGGSGRFPLSGAGALLVVAALVAVNFAANHLWQLPGRYLYSIVVILLTGTALPCAVLMVLRHQGMVDLRRWGYGLRAIELVKIAIGLGIAGTVAAFQVGAAVRADPAHAASLFVWLIGASLAEVLVFCGVMHNVVEHIAGRWLPRWAAIVAATVVTSVAFGLYHFSHAPPWNTLSTAATLMVVWLAVSAVFVGTRSLWAATAFNTVMATVGFILHRVTRLDDQPFAAGAVLAALGILIVLAAPLVRSGARHPVRPHSTTPAA